MIFNWFRLSFCQTRAKPPAAARHASHLSAITGNAWFGATKVGEIAVQRNFVIDEASWR
jgi:hypothetical protein